MPSENRPAAWKTLGAFAIIYLVWGSTFLAIRVGVRELPPFLFAAMRFMTAGGLLAGWVAVRGERLPRGREWGSVGVLALLIFVMDYGLLFWAEQRVPSGVAAVMLATVPAFTAVAEIWLLGTRRLTVRLAVALAIGIGGVGVLMGHSLEMGGPAVDRAGASLLIVAAVCWSLATVLTRKLPLPASKGMSSGMQMLVGGTLLLLVSGGAGEFGRFHPAAVSRGAWVALVYLIVMGSIVGFTAYVWLIHHESPTKVGTYAYVNPVVAVLLGHFFAAEVLSIRTLMGTMCVLVSVVVLTTGTPTRQAKAA